MAERKANENGRWRLARGAAHRAGEGNIGVYVESNLCRTYFIKGMKRIRPKSLGLPREAAAFQPLFIYGDERTMFQLTEQRQWCVPNSNENLIPGNMKLLESAIQQKQPDEYPGKKKGERGKNTK